MPHLGGPQPSDSWRRALTPARWSRFRGRNRHEAKKSVKTTAHIAHRHPLDRLPPSAQAESKMPFKHGPPEKMIFQLTLRRRGISDQAVLRAMEEEPREGFGDPSDRAHRLRDSALGIDCGQTISQPFVVAYMTEQL